MRTNNLIYHLKVIDDPLYKKIEKFKEIVKDIPKSNDRYYLSQFNAKRKLEKTVRIDKLKNISKLQNNISDKRIMALRNFFNIQSVK